MKTVFSGNNRFQFLILLVGLLTTISSVAQTDSASINFYSQAPVWETSEDEFMYPSDLYQNLRLEFDLTNPDAIGHLTIELSTGHWSAILHKYKLSIAQAISQGILTNNHMLIDYRNQMMGQSYKVSISIEDLMGAQHPTIVKTLSI